MPKLVRKMLLSCVEVIKYVRQTFYSHVLPNWLITNFASEERVLKQVIRKAYCRPLLLGAKFYELSRFEVGIMFLHHIHFLISHVFVAGDQQFSYDAKLVDVCLFAAAITWDICES